MNSSTVVLIVATAALSGTSIALWQRLQAERAEKAALQARIEQLAARAMQPPASAPATVPTPPPLTTPPSDERPKPTMGSAQSGLPAGRLIRGEDFRQRQQKLLQDPEYRSAMYVQQRTAMRQMYPDVRSALGLSSEQVDHLFDLLAEQQVRSMVETANMDLPPPNTPDAQREWTRRFEEQQRRNEAELVDALGHTVAQAWKDYQKSLGARTQVRELRNVLADSSDPLRPDQIEPLVKVLAQEEARFSEDMRKLYSERPPTDHLTMLKQHVEAQLRYNERRRDVAASYLSPTQLERFDEMLEEQAASARAQLKLAESQPPMSEPGIVMDAAGSISAVPGFMPVPPQP